MKPQITEDWQLRQAGIDYNNRLKPAFYQTINENERMIAGDQWHGVVANGLSTPVFNIFKPARNYFISAITSQKTAIQYSSSDLGESGQEIEKESEELADILTAYTEQLWESTKMDSKIRNCLSDAFNTGDTCIYVPWDDSVKTGLISGIDIEGNPVEILGDVDNEIIDTVNVYFGNPNDSRVNENGKPIQPYILLEFREVVDKVKEEAKKHGAKKEDINKIISDTDNEYQVGDRGSIELDEYAKTSNGKTTVLLKLWAKDGFIYARKSTKYITIRKDWNTKRRLYPLAWMNWETRKNSYHGQAPATGLCPNQRYINKQFAIAMVALMLAGNPKVVFDKARIDGWTSGVTAIGVDGPVTGVAQIIEGKGLPSNISEFIDKTIVLTKDMIGANDSLLGQINPEQASGAAIVAVQQQASIPLELVKQNLYQFIEDLGQIWLDTMIAYYGERTISVELLGQKVIKKIDFSSLRNKRLKIKIDVGASSYWSQITSVQTLDNLLATEKINFMQYLERLPAGFITKKQELIEELKQQEMAAQQQQQQTDQLLDSLSDEELAALQQLPPEEQQAYIDQITSIQ